MKYLICAVFLFACNSTKNVQDGPKPSTMTVHFESDNEAGVINYQIEKYNGSVWLMVQNVPPVGHANIYNVSIPSGTGLYRIKQQEMSKEIFTKSINVR